jgi:hypothetical protein
MASPTSSAVERLSPEYFACIRSAAWKAIRDRVVYRDRSVCRMCKTETNQPDVHHMTYERFGRERLDDLITVCRPCHERTHANQQIARMGQSNEPSWERRLDGWARKVYETESWERIVGREVAEWSFKQWLKRRGEWSAEDEFWS